MISSRKIWLCSFSLAVASAFLLNCSTPSTLALKPATILERDVFVCKGLSQDNRWVGVTDQFLPDRDSRVVVVAVLDRQDTRKVINFELINPLNNVVTSETIYSPKQNPLGVYFSIPNLMKLGGEGEWKATVFSDGEAIGESKFLIGEKKEEDKDDTIEYFVVGGEDDEETDESAQALSDEDRFSSYIREVTPTLSIPLPADSKPALTTEPTSAP